LFFVFTAPLCGVGFCPFFCCRKAGKVFLLLIFSLLSDFSLYFLVFSFLGIFVWIFGVFLILFLVFYGVFFAPFHPCQKTVGKGLIKKREKEGGNAHRQSV
jgi:ABC-type transport system involved in cytochrome bd biosynthesis fused ATPase/permease subunit